MFLLMFLSKRSKFGYYSKFPSFSFLEQKPLDITCDLQKQNLSSDSFFINLEEWSVNAFKQMWHLPMINYNKEVFKAVIKNCYWSRNLTFHFFFYLLQRKNDEKWWKMMKNDEKIWKMMKNAFYSIFSS